MNINGNGRVRKGDNGDDSEQTSGNRIVVDTMRTRIESLNPTKRIRKRSKRVLKSLEHLRRGLRDFRDVARMSGHSDEDPDHVIHRRVGDMLRSRFFQLDSLHSIQDPQSIASMGPRRRDHDSAREWRRNVALGGTHLPIDIVARNGHLFLPLFTYQIGPRKYTTTMSGLMDKVGDWTVPGRWDRSVGELIWEGLDGEMSRAIERGIVAPYTKETATVNDIHPEVFDRDIEEAEAALSSGASTINRFKSMKL